MALMGLRAYARHRGVNLKAVQDAIARGTIRKRPDGAIDSEEADADWDRNAGPAGKKSGAAGYGYADFRTAKESFRAKKEQLDYLERVKKLLDADSVRRETATRAALERDELLGLPVNFAHVLAEELGISPKLARRGLQSVMRAFLDQRSRVERKTVP
jgi:hypothetical protein